MEKHDYIHGEVFPTSGATRTHIDIAGNLYLALRLAFRDSDCSVITSDMRVQVEPGGRYTYPDLSAACGELDFLDAKERTFTNPTLVVEVLSDSTEAYDRTETLAAYRDVPSIREIVLVRQDRRSVEVYRREVVGRWVIEEVGPDGALELSSVDVEVTMDDLYAGTNL